MNFFSTARIGAVLVAALISIAATEGASAGTQYNRSGLSRVAWGATTGAAGAVINKPAVLVSPAVAGYQFLRNDAGKVYRGAKSAVKSVLGSIF
jgi:hypothetical protein